MSSLNEDIPASRMDLNRPDSKTALRGSGYESPSVVVMEISLVELLMGRDVRNDLVLDRRLAQDSWR